MIAVKPRPAWRSKLWKQRRTGWIGVDVGTCAIKLAQVQKVDSGWQIAGSCVIPTPEHQTLDQQKIANGWLEREIRFGLAADHGFRGRRAACLLPMSMAELRLMELPAASDDELREMIAQELMTGGGGDSQDQQFDFWEVSTAAGGNHQRMKRLAVLSVSRSLAASLATNLLNAGLQCQVLDGLPFALARAINMVSPPDNRGPVAAVDLGFSTGMFTLIADGKPLFTRNLRDCGMGRLLQSVVDGLGLSRQECQQLLMAYGFPPPATASKRSDLQHVIGELGSEMLDQMVEELKKTFSYLRQQYSDIFPQRMWLFGGGATIRNLAELLSLKIGFPIEVWRLSPRSMSPDSVDDPTAAILGPAVALSAIAYQT